MKLIAFIYCCGGIFRLTNCAPELDLKIEYNEAFDKQTALDKMDIAFVNKVNLNETAFVNNQITDGKLLLSLNSKQEPRNKHPLIRYESEGKHSDSTAGTINKIFATNNIITEIPNILFKQLRSDKIKENLNSFKISKRNSFYVTPAFKHPRLNVYGISGDSFEIYNNIQLNNDNPKISRVNYHNQHGIEQDYMFDNIGYIGNKNITNNIDKARYFSDNNKYNEIISNDKDKNKVKDIISLLNDPKVLEILKKQTHFIDKLENYLRSEKDEFEDLLTSIENKKNKTSTDMDKLEDKKTTRKLSTATIMIDETEVRKALRNDPLVQRILKMAKQKRLEYMKNAKKQYENMLYI